MAGLIIFEDIKRIKMGFQLTPIRSYSWIAAPDGLTFSSLLHFRDLRHTTGGSLGAKISSSHDEIGQEILRSSQLYFIPGTLLSAVCGYSIAYGGLVACYYSKELKSTYRTSSHLELSHFNYL